MSNSPRQLLRNARNGDFFSWCLSFCFASLAMTAAAQGQPGATNANPNGSVTVPPESPAPGQPGGMQATNPAWDNFLGIQKVSEDDDWTRHFRIGALVGFNITANFDVKKAISFSNQGLAQGNYDDGYVHPTGDGATRDWGYDNALQYDGVANTLTMHRATSFTVNSGTSSQDSDSVFPGFELAYGGNFWDWGKARIGWEFGFGLMPLSFKDNFSLDGTVNENSYVFSTAGIPSSLFPIAGYRGGPTGTWAISDASTPGAPITSGAHIEGWRKLDAMLYTFRLGPTAYWDLNEDLGLMVGAGPALGFVTEELKYNEAITVGSSSSTTYKGQVNGTDLVYGGYVNAMLTYHVEKNGDLYLGAQFMTMGNANISGGGRQAGLNLGGQVYITAGINWPF